VPRAALALACLPLACIALAGCIGVEAAQPVRNEAEAIRMARERCAFSQATGLWRARLHEGQWHVWLVADREPKEPAMGQVDIWIRAGDGRAGDCNHGY